MNTTIKFLFAAIVIFSSLTCIPASAQISESEHISRGFIVNSSTIVDISNKYGDIVVKTWDRDTLWVQIDYKVSGENYDQLKLKMNEINFELTQSGHYVVIDTKIGAPQSRIMKEFRKLKETIGFNDTEVEINMIITLPENLDLHLNNKFGNIYIDDYNGDITIDMANGRLKTHNLNGYANLKINFTDAIINHIEHGNIEVNYSDLNLTSTKKLRINSKTSNITITEASSLFVNSSRDDYRIRMISSFETTSSWTDISISEFTKESDIRMNYGELSIDKIKPNFDYLVVDANSTKINLIFDRNADINFDITTNKDISMPLDATIDSTERINPNEKVMRYIGRTGKIDISDPRLILKTKSSDINILKR
ncbi:MAG: hypothetical protein PF436_05220 [Prolixibacteraceae bacterium]|jgi:hypothetical protein|nr:hypothetical protein [Prolixibacteraceae bacterium]